MSERECSEVAKPPYSKSTSAPLPSLVLFIPFGFELGFGFSLDQMTARLGRTYHSWTTHAARRSSRSELDRLGNVTGFASDRDDDSEWVKVKGRWERPGFLLSCGHLCEGSYVRV